MIYSTEPKKWITTLFIRQDGERFVLGTGAFEFKASQLHFSGNTISNDVVELHGGDGALLAGQVRRPKAQSFDGYIANSTTDQSTTEDYRRQFLSFFRTGLYYTVVYIFSDGTAIKRIYGYLVDAPEVRELFQMSPQYHVALNFEDVNYYTYNENSDGDEIPSQSIDVSILGAVSGGLIWDSIGVVWDTNAKWEEGGGGGETILNVSTIAPIFPTWTVQGPCINPTIENVSTGTSLAYIGTVAQGQTLVVDCAAQTALLNGVNVADNISGDWLVINNGVNRFISEITSGDISHTTLRWSEIIG